MLFCVLDTRLTLVVDGEMAEIPRARCLVSSFEIIPMSWMRSPLTTAVSTAR